MATRALLLCGDEKAVLAITQILDELEISFEHSSEPPFALKRLANRHFDLLIVDCDNVQNATQVFNSARSSNLNKASIAIAIVEGKAGVPIAFRLGASLVLTKPVSLEQARNTLRTGVGMTRKDGPEAKAPASVVPATPSVPAASTPPPVMPTPAATTLAAPALTPQSPASTPVEKAPITATATTFSPAAASAPVAPKAPDIVAKTKEAEAPKIEKPIPAPVPVNAKPVPARPVPVDSKSTGEYKPALTNFTDEEPATRHPAPGLAKAAATSGKGTVETSKFDSVFAGPVPAAGAEKTKIGSAKSATGEDASKKDEKTAPILRIEDPLADDDSVLDPIRDNGVPSFGTMSHQSFAGLETQGSKGKGMLVAGLVLLLFGAGGYAAWLTQPAFRDILTFEYHEIGGKIAESRGHRQVKEVAAAAKPLPIPPAPPAPTPVPEPSQQIASTTPEDPGALQSPTVGTTTDANSGMNLPSANANSSPTPSESPAQVSKATTASTPQKGASLQSAKQDTTGHASATPAVVPAAANVPPSTAKKSSANDLIEVPEDFADDQIVHRVHPTYPKQARAKKLHGTVVLQAVVNKQGKVDSLQLVSGDAQLAQAAAEAVKQWRYKPYSRNGEPVDFQTRVTVDFKMP